LARRDILTDKDKLSLPAVTTGKESLLLSRRGKQKKQNKTLKSLLLPLSAQAGDPERETAINQTHMNDER
jgi:hypothetical protein